MNETLNDYDTLKAEYENSQAVIKKMLREQDEYALEIQRLKSDLTRVSEFYNKLSEEKYTLRAQLRDAQADAYVANKRYESGV